MTLTIYYGKATPMRAVGTRQCRLLSFAEKYQGWQTMGKDKSDRRALRALQAKGYLEVVGDQFRIVYP